MSKILKALSVMINLIASKLIASNTSFIGLILDKALHKSIDYLIFNFIDAPPPTWEQLENGLVAVRTVVHGLVDYIQNHSKKGADQQQVRGCCLKYADKSL